MQNSKLYFLASAFVCLGLALSFGCASSKVNSNSAAQIQPTPVPLKTLDKPAVKVNYEVVEKWQITDGEDRRIVIPADLQTEKGLFSVCDQLKEDMKDIKTTFTFGHRTAKSAKIQKNFDKATEQDKKYLGDNFLVCYIKSPTNKMHQCEIYVDGQGNGGKQLKVY